MIKTTFTPASTENPDSIPFADAAANSGVYGSGSDAPEFFSILGNVFRRNPDTGDVLNEIADDGVRKFRRIAGELEVSITF